MPKKVATKVATLTKNVATLEYNKLQQFAIAISKNPYISMIICTNIQQITSRKK